MKKMKTLYKKDPNDLGRVINEIDPECEWVFTNSIATIKWDGSACAIIDGEFYKRYDAKKGRKAPEGAIPCCEADPITGHHPHWVKCDRNNKADKWFWDAYDNTSGMYIEDGTFEAIGPKFNGNKQCLDNHYLVKHGQKSIEIVNFSYESLKKLLSGFSYEGIVFHELNGDRMCKIRRKDFGWKW